MLKIELDMNDVRARLQQAQGQLQNLRPFFKAVKNIMQTAVEENFTQQGRPRWTPLKPSTIARRGNKGDGKMLQVTGRLADSIVGRYDDNSATVGTNVRYAAIHQFGGKTKAHIIRPRRAGGLFWPGAKHPVKSVRHPGSQIPARPFLALTAEDKDQIRAAAITYLEGKP